MLPPTVFPVEMEVCHRWKAGRNRFHRTRSVEAEGPQRDDGRKEEKEEEQIERSFPGHLQRRRTLAFFDECSFDSGNDVSDRHSDVTASSKFASD